MGIRPKVLKVKDGENWLSFFCLYSIENVDNNTEQKMLSGKIKVDQKGFRKHITGEIDYVKQDTLTAFNRLAKQNIFNEVQYIDDDGEVKTEVFKIAPFNPTVLAYRNDLPLWHGCVLDFIGQDLSNGEQEQPEGENDENSPEL